MISAFLAQSQNIFNNITSFHQSNNMSHVLQIFLNDLCNFYYKLKIPFCKIFWCTNLLKKIRLLHIQLVCYHQLILAIVV